MSFSEESWRCFFAGAGVAVSSSEVARLTVRGLLRGELPSVGEEKRTNEDVRQVAKT